MKKSRLELIKTLTVNRRQDDPYAPDTFEFYSSQQMIDELVWLIGQLAQTQFITSVTFEYDPGGSWLDGTHREIRPLWTKLHYSTISHTYAWVCGDEYGDMHRTEAFDLAWLRDGVQFQHQMIHRDSPT